MITMKEAWDGWKIDPALTNLIDNWVRVPRPDWVEIDDDVAELINKEPERAFMLLMGLVQRIEDEKLFRYFAAGPLESFLGINGEAFVPLLREVALEHGRLRKALAGVWQGAMSKAVWREVEVLADH